MTRSLLMIIVLLATASAAHAQKATEIYIPIGRSPGLSGKVTVTGSIDTVDDHTMIMSVRGAGGGWRAVLTDRSKIYIDRSAQRRPNRYGTADDCRPGLYCEIKYVGDDAAALRGRDDPGEIEWIKIRPDNGRSQAEPAARMASAWRWASYSCAAYAAASCGNSGTGAPGRKQREEVRDADVPVAARRLDVVDRIGGAPCGEQPEEVEDAHRAVAVRVGRA